MKSNSRAVEMIRLLESAGYTMQDLEQLILAIEKVRPKEYETKDKKFRKKVVNLLMEVGIPQGNLGFELLATAIELAYQQPFLFEHITMELYKEVAERHGTTRDRVERNIRTVIERGWETCNYETYRKFFGNSISKNTGKPTITQFIKTMVNYIKLEE